MGQRDHVPNVCLAKNLLENHSSQNLTEINYFNYVINVVALSFLQAQRVNLSDANDACQYFADSTDFSSLFLFQTSVNVVN